MSSFDAYELPDGFDRLENFNSVNCTDGFSVRYPRLSATDQIGLVNILAEANREIKKIPVSEVIRAIGTVSARLVDKDHRLRKKILEIMVPTAGVSPEMAETILTGMASDWTEEKMSGLLGREFTAPEMLDDFQRIDSGRSQKAQGFPVNLTVGSGTVPGVGVTALIRALLLKSSVLLKPGLGDVALPVLFARALRAENEMFRKCLAVVYWDGLKDRVEKQVLKKVGVVVAYGSDETIGSISSRTPITTNFVTYRHRLGIGLVGREALEDGISYDSAREVARSISIFDQKGCVSPQILYVEQGGCITPEDWIVQLDSAMEEMAGHLPLGATNRRETIRLQQLYAATELSRQAGTGVFMLGGVGKAWTIIFDPGLLMKWSDCRRVVYVKPILDLMQVREVLIDSSHHLQTVAVAGAVGRRQQIASMLSEVGVTRVTSFREAPWPKLWWHQDGRSVFQGLYRLVDLEDSVD